MSPRRRIFGLALVALAVPFPALALDGGASAEPTTQSLTVTASLDSCGLAGTQVLCKINAGWNALEGAENYTVSVASPSGSVSEQGETSGPGSSVWVPYTGPGTYSVTVTAWGTPPGAEDDGSPEVIARESSKSGGAAEAAKTPPPSLAPGESRETSEAEVSNEPVAGDPALPGDPRDEVPTCEEPLVDELPESAPPEEEDADAPSETAPPPPEVADTIPGDDDCAD